MKYEMFILCLLYLDNFYNFLEIIYIDKSIVIIKFIKSCICTITALST